MSYGTGDREYVQSENPGKKLHNPERSPGLDLIDFQTKAVSDEFIFVRASTQNPPIRLLPTFLI